MKIFRPSRESRGPDPYLELKIVLFTLGAALGIVGIISGRELLVGIGILVLAIGVLLRFLQRGE
jgi:uncharacterized membrane protein YedE/YeeE